MAAFDYNQSNINALESTLSVERFRTYVQLAGGNRRRAVDIYERNTAISEALYGVMQATEVALRNAIHRAMTDGYGSMWFEAPSLALEPPQLEKLGKAKSEIQRDKRPLTPGAIVAELGLGFWTSLLASGYEKRLWVPHLHKAFPHAKALRRNQDGSDTVIRLSRPQIFDQLDRIRTLRNRIAHHEPIVKMDLPKLYSGALDALSWICPISESWVRATNCFNARFHAKPLSYEPPKIAVPINPRPGMPGIVSKA